MKVEVSTETYQVGAHFKALIKGILVAPLKSFERFFSYFELPCRTVAYPAPQWEKSLLVWKVKAVRPATTAQVRKKACSTTDTS